MSEKKEAKQSEVPKKETKKKKSHIWLWIVILFIIWWFNNYTLAVNNVSMESSKVSSKMRFAIIGDLHATKHGIKNQKIFENVDKEKPDAILFLGDIPQW